MGEQHNKPIQLSFNSSLRVDFQGSRVTSDGGLILVRELEERLGMGALIEQHLTDTRRGRNTQFPLADLLRQSVYSRLAGYEDVNDAERVSARSDLSAHLFNRVLRHTDWNLRSIRRLSNQLRRHVSWRQYIFPWAVERAKQRYPRPF